MKKKLELIKEKARDEYLYCVYLDGEVVYASAYLSRATKFYEDMKKGNKTPDHEVLSSETI